MSDFTAKQQDERGIWQQGERFVADLYRSRGWEVIHREEQKMGDFFDFEIVGYNRTVRKKIDVKTDEWCSKPDRPSGNFVIELVERLWRPEQGQKNAIGWALHGDGEDVLIAFLDWHTREVFEVPRALLASWAFDRERRLYPFLSRHPKGYISFGVKVPKEMLEQYRLH